MITTDEKSHVQIVYSNSSHSLLYINYKLLSPVAILPTYSTEGSCGSDLHSSIETIINPGEISMVSTGLALEIPTTHSGFICSRSGLASKNGIIVLNSPGILDSDYRGEIKVVLMNLGKEPFQIEVGMRIAQVLFLPYSKAIFNQVSELTQTQRGERGFGSTGNAAKVAEVTKEVAK